MVGRVASYASTGLILAASMVAFQVHTATANRRFLMLLPAAALAASAQPTGAAGLIFPGSVVGLAHRYFADLNAHRYASAARLEAPCNQEVVEHPAGSAVASVTLLRGRGSVKEAARRLSFVRAVRVDRVRSYETPLLRRYHMAGFDVAGAYRFVYTGAPRGASNFRRPSGFYHVHVVVRRCGSSWGVDAGWLEGSPADFAGGICTKQCNVICDASDCRRIW